MFVDAIIHMRDLFVVPNSRLRPLGYFFCVWYNSYLNSVGLGLGLGFCLSNKPPGDPDAVHGPPRPPPSTVARQARERELQKRFLSSLSTKRDFNMNKP